MNEAVKETSMLVDKFRIINTNLFDVRAALRQYAVVKVSEAQSCKISTRIVW